MLETSSQIPDSKPDSIESKFNPLTKVTEEVYIKSDRLDMKKISIWQALDLVFIISDRSDLILLVF